MKQVEAYHDAHKAVARGPDPSQYNGEDESSGSARTAGADQLAPLAPALAPTLTACSTPTCMLACSKRLL